jgi:hypothetical protein
MLHGSVPHNYGSTYTDSYGSTQRSQFLEVIFLYLFELETDL